VKLSVQEETIVKHSLAQRACFIGDALACDIFDGGHNLESKKICLGEREVGQTSNRCRRHSASCCGRSDPISEVREVVIGPDLIQAAAAEKATGLVHDCKVVFTSIFPGFCAALGPLLAFRQRVAGVTPGQPRKNLRNGLGGGLEEKRRVGPLIWADQDLSHVPYRNAAAVHTAPARSTTPKTIMIGGISLSAIRTMKTRSSNGRPHVVQRKKGITS